MDPQPIQAEIYAQANEDAAKVVESLLDQDRDPLLIGLTGAIMFASASVSTGLDSFEYEAPDGHTVRISVEHVGVSNED